MNLVIKLFAQYRKGRFKVEKKVYKQGICVQDIIDELGIALEFPLGVLMVNGKHELPTYQPKEGDEIALFPKIGGG